VIWKGSDTRYWYYVLGLANCGKPQTRWEIKVFRFSQQVLTTWWSSFGFLHHAVAKCFNVSEECTASIFRVNELLLLDSKVMGKKKFCHLCKMTGGS